eukprot:CFRG1873T1
MIGNKMKDGRGNYRQLRNLNPTDDWHTSQFKKPTQSIPFRAIGLAAALFISGFLLIVLGFMILTGYVDTKDSDRGIPLLFLGILIFIPGFYHVRIAYYAYKGYRGYSYQDIPSAQ